MGGQHPLHAVEAAVDHAQCAGVRPPARRSSGTTASSPYRRGGPDSRASAACTSGRNAGSGDPPARSRTPSGTDGVGRRQRRAVGDAQPAARPRDDDPAPAQLGHRARDGRRAHVEPRGQRPHRRQALSGRERAGRHQPLDRRRDLPPVAAVDILYRHSPPNCTSTDASLLPTHQAPPPAQARPPRPRDDRRDPRRGPAGPPRLRDGRPAVRHPDAARPPRRRGPRPRQRGQPRAAPPRRRRARVPHGDADGRPRARAQRLPPLDQLPQRRAARLRPGCSRARTRRRARWRRSPSAWSRAAGRASAGPSSRSSRAPRSSASRSTRPRPRSAPARRATTTRTTRATRGPASCRWGSGSARRSPTRCCARASACRSTSRAANLPSSATDRAAGAPDAGRVRRIGPCGEDAHADPDAGLPAGRRAEADDAPTGAT